MPTARAQLALWIESADGTIMQTLRLTEATAVHGIGNRPGALQMNSGFRWPYGRREGVLPVWGHRRASHPDSIDFRRVIFQDRRYEGLASRTSNDASRDDYFCLSFDASRSARDALDAVSCASQFNSDKGSFITEGQVADGYGEPYEAVPGMGTMRPLSYHSNYPPRRDTLRCSSPGCSDHPDVALFQDHVREVMPEIDAITMATPAGDAPQSIQFSIPADWPDGEYRVFLEINVEGDYNDSYNASTHPTPTAPAEAWDYWARNYGYPYRGQPSVVYEVPVTIAPAGGLYEASTPVGYGALEGQDGDIRALDGSISVDAEGAPGSGGDRLRLSSGGNRVKVEVVPTNVCGGPNPPPECGQECSPSRPCSEGFVCSETNECVGMCDIPMAPEPVSELELENHPDEASSHHFAVIRFRVPESNRDINRYEVRFSTIPIVDDLSFEQALPAKGASIDSVELIVPTNGFEGDMIELEMGGMIPQTEFYVAVRAIDVCNAGSEIRVAQIMTTEINYTTVSPCFVATAAYGTDMAGEISMLRRFRDRHLMTSTVGRAFVATYYEVGPAAADFIRERPWLRAASRAVLRPFVTIAELLE